jgi:hypothetical protein
MKPWEIERTRRKLKNLSAVKSIEIFFDLYQAARKIIKKTVLSENPRLSPKQLRIKINELAESIGRL